LGSANYKLTDLIKGIFQLHNDSYVAYICVIFYANVDNNRSLQ